MNPKVSILVPIYGVEKFIERCVVSLFEQTFHDIEYVFINDCTKDKSIDIIKSLIEVYPNRKSQVQIVNHQENKGLAGARNTGVERASGDYILHIDSDDYVDTKIVELMYNAAVMDDSDIVVCDFYMEFSKSVLFVKQDIKDSKENYLKSVLSGQTMSPVWNKLIKRDLYIKNDIRAEEGVNLGEDFMITPKLIYFAEKVNKVDSPLYYYSQMNPQAYTAQILSKKSIDNLVFVLHDLTFFFRNKWNSDFYEESLLQGLCRKKMDLLFFADKKYLNELIDLFPETNTLKSNSFLLKRDVISYTLLKKRCIVFFVLYRKLYQILFDIKKVLLRNK